MTFTRKDSVKPHINRHHKDVVTDAREAEHEAWSLEPPIPPADTAFNMDPPQPPQQQIALLCQSTDSGPALTQDAPPPTYYDDVDFGLLSDFVPGLDITSEGDGAWNMGWYRGTPAGNETGPPESASSWGPQRSDAAAAPDRLEGHAGLGVSEAKMQEIASEMSNLDLPVS